MENTKLRLQSALTVIDEIVSNLSYCADEIISSEGRQSNPSNQYREQTFSKLSQHNSTRETFRPYPCAPYRSIQKVIKGSRDCADEICYNERTSEKETDKKFGQDCKRQLSQFNLNTVIKDLTDKVETIISTERKNEDLRPMKSGHDLEQRLSQYQIPEPCHSSDNMNKLRVYQEIRSKAVRAMKSANSLTQLFSNCRLVEPHLSQERSELNQSFTKSKCDDNFYTKKGRERDESVIKSEYELKQPQQCRQTRSAARN